MQAQPESSSTWERELIEKALLENVKEQRRARRWRGFYKFLLLAFFAIVIFMIFQGRPTKQALKEHVAQIDLVGTVGQQQEIEAENVISSLQRAFSEQRVKAVLLRINSPGGTPVQSAYIYDEIMRLRKLHPEKKVYSVVADICASGAYYIAASSDEIYANNSSIVGSIGVLMPNFGFVEVMKKVGVEQRSLSAGKNKMFLDPFAEKDEEQVRFAKSLLDDIHGHFIKAVKTGRGDRLKGSDELLFNGLFWTGDKALALGLIDGIGDADKVKRDIIKLEETVDYTVTTNILDKMVSRLGVSAAKQFAAELGVHQNMQLR